MYWRDLEDIPEDASTNSSEDIQSKITSYSVWLAEFRENIPEDDPLWLEYGPERKNAWIDYFYYYGPSPRGSVSRPVNSVSVEKNFMDATGHSYEKVRAVKAILKSSNEFRCFMHSYLKWDMEDDWASRLTDGVHEKRGIELDKSIGSCLIDWIFSEVS